MSKKSVSKFDAESRRSLFGAEDAENEDIERFKEYFVGNKAYDEVRSELSIRLVVGAKGTGKSALLKRSYIEDIENQEIAIWLKPDDLDIEKIQKGTEFNKKSYTGKEPLQMPLQKKLYQIFFQKFQSKIYLI